MVQRCNWLGILVGLLLAAHWGQGQGIRFVEGSFEEAMATAHRADKMIFVVVCDGEMEACTILQDEIFTDPAVGKVYDERFVSWRLDAQLLSESPFWGNIRILNIPEYLFLDAAGNPQFRAHRLKDVPEMLAMADAAMDPANHLDQWIKRFANGDRDPDFVQEFIVQMDAVGKNMEAESKDYLQHLPKESLLQTRNWVIAGIGVTEIQSEVFHYVLDHRKQFEAQFGEDLVNGFILKVYGKSLATAVEDQNPKRLADCQAVVRQLLGAEAAQPIILQDELTYHEGGQKWSLYTSKAQELFDAYPLEDAELYNRVAWNVYLHADDKAQWTAAEAWARRSVVLQPAYWNWHTLGSLQWKLGKKEAAMTSAQEALEYVEPGTMEEDEVKSLIEAIKK